MSERLGDAALCCAALLHPSPPPPRSIPLHHLPLCLAPMPPCPASSAPQLICMVSAGHACMHDRLHGSPQPAPVPHQPAFCSTSACAARTRQCWLRWWLACWICCGVEVTAAAPQPRVPSRASLQGTATATRCGASVQGGPGACTQAQLAMPAAQHLIPGAKQGSPCSPRLQLGWASGSVPTQLCVPHSMLPVMPLCALPACRRCRSRLQRQAQSRCSWRFCAQSKTWHARQLPQVRALTFLVGCTSMYTVYTTVTPQHRMLGTARVHVLPCLPSLACLS